MQKLKEKIKNEPIIFLFRKMWQFAGERKKKIILSTAFFVISNIIDLLNPLVLAVLLNEIQTNGINDTNIRYLMLIMIVPFVIMLSFWFFHGFGRILERQNSYYQK
jgi:ABC-type multidrug transport system fused ATPase/permease subunit